MPSQWLERVPSQCISDWSRGGEGGSEAGAYLRLVDTCITQRKAQGPFRTWNESQKEEQRILQDGDSVIGREPHEITKANKMKPF